MINSVCGIGSTGRICTDLATSLEQHGHEVKIAYGRGDVSREFQKYAFRIGTDIDTKIHGLRARLLDQSGLGSKKATEKFLDWMERYDPDVIHLHNLHGYYIHVPTLFEKLKTTRAKIIWTLHDSWAFSGHSGTCDKVECKKWRYGCGNCPLIKQYPSSLLDRSGFNWEWKRQCFQGINKLTIVTPSQWLAKEVRRSILGEYNITVIPNGIDTDIFKSQQTGLKAKLGIEKKYMILGVSSSWHKYKGLYDFYELSERLDQDKYQIVLVGLTEKQLKQLPKEIIGVSKTKDTHELAEFYNAADVFVNLTYCDVFGMVNIEALACNTPVITYNTGGSPETVRDYGGIIIDKGNLLGVIKSMEDAITKRTIMGKGDVIEKRYGKKQIMNQYIMLYK